MTGEMEGSGEQQTHSLLFKEAALQQGKAVQAGA